jgi:hypothetical protein
LTNNSVLGASARADKYELRFPVSVLGQRIFQEFSGLLDYIYKTPRFVDEEKKRELRKLSDYYPFTGETERDAEAATMRSIRWSFEGAKIHQLFPNLMASSNLFLIISYHERSLRTLCVELAKEKNLPEDLLQGLPMNGLYKFLKEAGTDWWQASYSLEVEVARKFRNFLIHQGGILNNSKKSRDVCEYVDKRSYLPKTLRNQEFEKIWSPTNRIQKMELGEQLQVSNDYVWIAAVCFRDNVVELCDHAFEIVK